MSHLYTNDIKWLLQTTSKFKTTKYKNVQKQKKNPFSQAQFQRL